MRPEMIIENTLRPEQFAAAAAVGVTGVATSKGDNTLLIILLALLAIGIVYLAYQHHLDSQSNANDDQRIH